MDRWLTWVGALRLLTSYVRLFRFSRVPPGAADNVFEYLVSGYDHCFSLRVRQDDCWNINNSTHFLVTQSPTRYISSPSVDQNSWPGPFEASERLWETHSPLCGALTLDDIICLTSLTSPFRYLFLKSLFFLPASTLLTTLFFTVNLVWSKVKLL